MNKELKLLADKYGKRAVDDLKAKLLSDDTNASGDTLNSIKYSIKGGDIVLEFDPTINILDEGLNAGQRISVSGSDGIVRWIRLKVLDLDSPKVLLLREIMRLVLSL